MGERERSRAKKNLGVLLVIYACGFLAQMCIRFFTTFFLQQNCNVVNQIRQQKQANNKMF